ncbi:hypothetical protein CBS101457_001372 [Exobasidium rhododendri]|nr:hypothetical protein CBS101457_001372 [Exobasidium rhododendri]
MSVSEIEHNLAAVEAALQDHSLEGSLNPLSLRSKILAPRHTSMMSTKVVTEAELNDFEMLSVPAEGRITLPPDQEVAIADAIKQVRRAISSSNLPQIPNEDESVSDLAHSRSLEPQLQQMSLLPQDESTPLRAARVRQESMQDVEEAYARMIDLVDTAAGIDANSPMPNVKSRAKRSTHAQVSSVSQQGQGNLHYLTSPNRKVPRQQDRSRTQSAAHVPSSTGSTSSSRAARQQLLRESDTLARAIASSRSSQLQLPRETDEPRLRGRSSNISMGSRRAISESPPRRPSVGSNSTKVSQYYQASSPVHRSFKGNGFSNEEYVDIAPTSQMPTRVGSLMEIVDKDGAYYASQSKHKMQGELSPPASMMALQRRHNLERDSLLDMLERSRSEVSTFKVRNEDLKADLHQEVTRLLELQREISRKDANEAMMLSRISRLEREIKKEHADRLRTAELIRKSVVRRR